MPLTRAFRTTVSERLQRDASFRRAMRRARATTHNRMPHEMMLCVHHGEDHRALSFEALIGYLRPCVHRTGLDEVARATSISRRALRRILAPGYDMRLSHFIGICDALGVQLGIETKDAHEKPTVSPSLDEMVEKITPENRHGDYGK